MLNNQYGSPVVLPRTSERERGYKLRSISQGPLPDSFQMGPVEVLLHLLCLCPPCCKSLPYIQGRSLCDSQLIGPRLIHPLVLVTHDLTAESQATVTHRPTSALLLYEPLSELLISIPLNSPHNSPLYDALYNPLLRSLDYSSYSPYITLFLADSISLSIVFSI